MNQLTKGQFYGQTNKTICLDGLTLTDTVYTHDTVDWHYHENAYFTFILQGNVVEGNKKEVYKCTPGSLLFHNWQDPHYNIKPPGFTRGFHVEIEKHWLENADMKNTFQGSVNSSNPGLKLLMYKVFRSSLVEDATLAVSVEALLLEILCTLQCGTATLYKKPDWVTLINEILHDHIGDTITLSGLSQMLDIHPVHLSRDFSKYFHCNLGEYIRKLKVEKAMSLMASQKKPFTEIAYECGFYDQSHFIKCFRELNGLKPSQHLELLLKSRC